ncbi:IS66 family transposase [bacterium]|nr:IS66 family transposase [bacterium]
MKRATREELKKLIEISPEAVIDLIMALYDKIEEQGIEIKKQGEKIKELEERLNQNSQNTSKPPSKDRFKVIRKKKETKNTNGKKTKKGTKKPLQMVAEPDERVELKLNKCPECGCNLEAEALREIEKRQEIDIQIKVITTQYEAEKKHCPNCKKTRTAAFPQNVKARIQYGETVRAMTVYLTEDNMISYNRVQRFFEDVAGLGISQSTLVNINRELSEQLEEALAEIKKRIKESPVVGFDETGMRKKLKIEWLHTAATEKLTCLHIDDKRGKEGTDRAGILPEYAGTAIHDFWKTYESYGKCAHAYCNAHIIRELRAAEERTGQPWCTNMKNLLKSAYKDKKNGKQKGKRMSLEKKRFYADRYDTFIQMGHSQIPPPEKGKKKRGRTKKSKELNLLLRLENHKDGILAFMYDDKIPFDNNIAERSFRMAKVKDKVSGAFRGAGDVFFAAIRSFTDSARKNGLNIFEALRFCFRGFSPLLIVNALFSS